MAVCAKLYQNLVKTVEGLFLRKVNVLFVSAPSCGRTAIVKALFKFTSISEMSKSKSCITMKCATDDTLFIIRSMPISKSTQMRLNFFYNKCDILAYVHDMTSDKEETRAARELLNSLVYRNAWNKANLIVLCTKNDLVSGEKSIGDVAIDLGLPKICDRAVACISTSAETESNLNVILDWLKNPVTDMS